MQKKCDCFYEACRYWIDGYSKKSLGVKEKASGWDSTIKDAVKTTK